MYSSNLRFKIYIELIINFLKNKWNSIVLNYTYLSVEYIIFIINFNKIIIKTISEWQETIFKII